MPLLLISVLLARGPIRAQASDIELLERIILQNEESLRKLDSYSMKVEWTSFSTDSGGKSRSQAKGAFKGEGGKAWSRIDLNAVDVVTGKEIKHTWRTVLNDKYLGIWPNTSELPTESMRVWQHEHASIDAMSEENRQRFLVNSEMWNPRNHGFSVDGFPLRKMLLEPARQWKGIRVEVASTKTAEGMEVVTVRQFYPVPGSDPNSESGESYHNAEVEFSPGHGYLATKLRSFLPSGKPGEDLDITPKEVAPGIWAAGVVKMRRYDMTSEAAKADASTDSHDNRIEGGLDLVMTEAEIGKDFPDDQFTLEALGFPKDQVRVMVEHVNGEAETWIYRNGTFIPQSNMYK